MRLRAAGQIRIPTSSRTQPSQQVELVRNWMERGNSKNLRQKKVSNVSGGIDAFLAGYRFPYTTLPPESAWPSISSSSVSRCTLAARSERLRSCMPHRELSTGQSRPLGWPPAAKVPAHSLEAPPPQKTPTRYDNIRIPTTLPQTFDVHTGRSMNLQFSNSDIRNPKH